MVSPHLFNPTALQAGVPFHMIRDFYNYLYEHMQPGDAVLAILSNDLFSTLQYADPITMRALPRITTFIYMNFPAGSWGSRETTLAWLNNKEAKDGIE